VAKSIEDLRHVELEVQTIPVDAIDPNPRNPNELPEEKMEALKRDIREHGFKQPILVREKAEGEELRYELIDGEHRWRALRELAAESVPAVVVDPDTDDEAALAMISMNNLRGEFIPIKFALLLADLNRRIPEDELARRLGMDTAAIRDSLALATFTDPLPEKVRESVEREEREAPEVIQFVLMKRDHEVVERVIGHLVSETGDRSKALVKLCRDFEKG
jgi:ParB family transcriptional regulator, chromosome partitioning protein